MIETVLTLITDISSKAYKIVLNNRAESESEEKILYFKINNHMQSLQLGLCTVREVVCAHRYAKNDITIIIV